VDLTLEGDLVGLYFSLEKNPPPPLPQPLPCEGELVDGWPWKLDPTKVEPRKDDPKIVSLTRV
jgi:hypothetical protein